LYCVAKVCQWFSGPAHHDAIDQHARHFHLSRIERATFGDALDLRDHDAVGIARGHGDGERLHRQITVRVAGCSPDDTNIDREPLVEEIFLAISSAKPMPTKPPVASVSPSRMSFTASAAETTGLSRRA
jgi:hypothetical protein